VSQGTGLLPKKSAVGCPLFSNLVNGRHKQACSPLFLSLHLKPTGLLWLFFLFSITILLFPMKEMKKAFIALLFFFFSCCPKPIQRYRYTPSPSAYTKSVVDLRSKDIPGVSYEGSFFLPFFFFSPYSDSVSSNAFPFSRRTAGLSTLPVH